MERRSVEESSRMGRLGINEGTVSAAWGIEERERRMRRPLYSAPALQKYPNIPADNGKADAGSGM
jgi:hypothetical protein